MTLVVDACVLRSAGSSGSPTPTECRAILEEIKNSRKHVSIDRKLLAEWRRHKSRYSATWISAMFSRRLIEQIDRFSGKSISVEDAVSKLGEPDRSVALKDIHLIRIAVDRGYCVISCERRCRAAFHKAAVYCSEMSKVFWIFPFEPGACDAVAGRCVTPPEWRLGSA